MTLFDRDAEGRNPAIPGDADIVSVTCLTDMDILLLALDDRENPTTQAAGHLRVCDSCQSRMTAIRRVLGEIAARHDDTTAVGDPCLDDAALTQLADSGNAEGAAPEHIAHLLRCARCRSELASLANLLTDPEVSEEIRRVDTSRTPWTARRRAFALHVGALAAAAVVFLLVWPGVEQFSSVNRRSAVADSAPHRAPVITASETPILAAPVGEINALTGFRWSAVSGSDRYRLTLYDDAGHVVYEAKVADTALTLPDSVVTIPGRSYFWQVEARTGVERWTPPELVEFRILPRRP